MTAQKITYRPKVAFETSQARNCFNVELFNIERPGSGRKSEIATKVFGVCYQSFWNDHQSFWNEK